MKGVKIDLKTFWAWLCLRVNIKLVFGVIIWEAKSPDHHELYYGVMYVIFMQC